VFEQLKFEFPPPPQPPTVAAKWNTPLRAALARSELDVHPPVEGRALTLEEELGW
jgi:hypothetical protein